jgi:hypothetical protein
VRPPCVDGAHRLPERARRPRRRRPRDVWNHERRRGFVWVGAGDLSWVVAGIGACDEATRGGAGDLSWVVAGIGACDEAPAAARATRHERRRGRLVMSGVGSMSQLRSILVPSSSARRW